MVNQETNLIKRIEALEKTISLLTSGNTIPLNIDQALNGRGFIKVPALITGSYGTQSVAVIGGGGGGVTVPAQPSGTVSVAVKGITYKFLYQ